LFLFVLFLLARSSYGEFLLLPLGSVPSAANAVNGAISNLLWKGAFVFFLFGTIDLFRQQKKYTDKLKMSKQELKEEHKESEGDPHIKGRIRRLQRDASRRLRWL
jgi:flagellar biosynthetic protein FlhB